MADYIYLLENRLSPAQREALRVVTDAARAKGLTVFLVGGAVRDLTSGSPVRDLDVAVQGNALKLAKELEHAGAVIQGEHKPMQALFLSFPGGVRMEVGSTLSVTYPKPGAPVVHAATILEDLRRRDFTANAMALSLNPGSYGLLMDPLNGVADIENRELRLVSNYGFIEDPVRMIRAARLMARLGWALEEKTATRYETGKAEGYISALSEYLRGAETEEIVHEEDPLRVLKRLEAEGWMAHLAPYWTVAKVNAPELERLRDLQTQFQIHGIHPEMGAVSFPLLTAKLSPKELQTLKAGFPRQGFVAELEGLDAKAKELATQLTGKATALPSQTWKLLHSAPADVVLAAAFGSKSTALAAKLKSFQTEWPQARQKIPYTLLQEMRIVPELPGYDALIESLFFELMDGKLGTTEEMKAFLEPHSPPAPPPPLNMRKLRAPKKDAKGAKGRARKAVLDEDEVDDAVELDPAVEEELKGVLAEGVGDIEIDAAEVDLDDLSSDAEPEAELDEELVPVKPVAVKAPAVPSAAAVVLPATAAAAKSSSAKSAPAKATPVKAVPAKVAAVKVVAKSAPVKAAPVKSIPAKAPAKATVPPPAKTPAVKTAAPAVKAPVKAAAATVVAKKAVPVKVVAKKAESAKPAVKTPAKSAPAKAVKTAPKKAVPVTAAVKTAAPAQKAVKAAVKVVATAAPKKAIKTVAKSAPAKKPTRR
jgi:tRNA nucleotidyltransferase/poly(A) polymerase